MKRVATEKYADGGRSQNLRRVIYAYIIIHSTRLGRDVNQKIVFDLFRL